MAVKRVNKHAHLVLFAALELNAVGRTHSKPGPGGEFGTWIVDGAGLPAFNFTCDQRRSPYIQDYSHKCRDSAMPPQGSRGPFGEDATTSIFQIGNDELVVLLSSYGYAQVRQDEGGPKLLNDFSPTESQYGGGLGYVVDQRTGKMALSTYYSAKVAQLYTARDYGVGYARRKVQNEAGLHMEQKLIVPFGTDPVVVSQTILTNMGSKPAQLSYYEAWGGSIWQMANGQSSKARRVFQDKHYTTNVQPLQTAFGLTLRQVYNGSHAADTPPDAEAAGATLWDEDPPLTFFVNPYEHDITTDAACDPEAFFGTGGAAAPAFAMQCSWGTLPRQSNGAMILRRNISIAAGETIEFAFMYGYITSRSSLSSLLSKYSFGLTRGNELQTQNGEMWRRASPRIDMPGNKIISREIIWNYAMSRQALTFDSYFNEMILDQGTAYRYDTGFQGAARDPLQHVLPFIYTDGAIVRSILRYTLKELHPPNTWRAGDTIANLPYFVAGHGIVGPPSSRPSDEELYLLFTATEYVLATRDTQFLQESVTAYNSTVNRTVLEALVDCFVYIRDHIGVGKHGLMRMQTGDWNDVFVQEAMNSGSTRDEVIKGAESATNAAMAAAILPRFADVIKLCAKEGHVEQKCVDAVPSIRAFAAQQAQALKSHAWNGEWLNRAWIPIANKSAAGADQFPDGWACTNGLDRRLCLEPQPWAILASSWAAAPEGQTSASILSPRQAATLIKSLRRELTSPIGSTVLNKVFSRSQRIKTRLTHVSVRGAADAGQHENGGVWPSQNHPLVLALATMNSSLALQEWMANSRSAQAWAYPKFWPGIWSAADVATSHLSRDGQAGTQAWPSMPVLCTHPHSWPVYSALHLAGLTFNAAGLHARPTFTSGLGNFNYETQLATIQRKRIGPDVYEYSGLWRPTGSTTSTCTITLDLALAHTGEAVVLNQVVKTPDATIETSRVPRKLLRDKVVTLAKDVFCERGQSLSWIVNVEQV